MTKLKKYNPLFLAGLFIVLYNPPIFLFNATHLVGGVSILYLLFSKRTISVLLNKHVKYIIIGFVFTFLYLLIFSSLINGADLTSSLTPIFFLIDVIPFGLAFFVYSKKAKLNSQDFLDIVIVVAIIQSIFSIVSLLLPSVQKIFVDRLVNYGYTEDYYRLSKNRLYGFSGQLTFAMPVLQAVVAVITFTHKKNIVYKFISFFIFLSGIINARVSILVFAVGLISFFLFSKIRPLKKLLFLFSVFLAILLFVIFGLPAIKMYSINTYDWIMTGINDFTGIFTNKFDDYSNASYFMDASNYRLPSSLIGILFGRGITLMGNESIYGFSSDVGFVNDIWFGGILFVAIYYSIFFSMMVIIFKRRNMNSYSSFLSVFLLLSCLICNIKGQIFGVNGFTSFLIILYFFLSLDNRFKTIIKA